MQLALAQTLEDTTTGILLDSLRSADHIITPFDYWLLDNVLPEDVIDDVLALPFPPPSNAVFDGRRESNNSSRVYFTAENQKNFPVCKDIADAFHNLCIINQIERRTGADLSKGILRIEYCQDIDGFWLEPHRDVSAKLFTMLIYLSDDPNLADAGTDIYDSSPEHNLVTRSPYARNKGLIFIPGENTWHGFGKRPIKGLRQSIIINYVSPAWQNVSELAYAP